MTADDNSFSSKEIFYQRRESIDGLTRRLSDPVAVVPLKELQALWQQSEIIIYATRPKNFDNGFSLASRIRGALGRQLEYYEPSYLYEVMFKEGWVPSLPTAVARPYIIKCIPQGDLIQIRLSLFGFFRGWLDEVKENLINALRGNIALYPGCHTGTAIEIQKVEEIYHVPTTDTTSESKSQCLLKFDSPLCMRREHSVMGHDKDLLPMLLKRIIALANWQDLAIGDIADYQQAISEVHCDSNQFQVVMSERFSSAQTITWHLMVGCTGSIILNGNIEDIAPLLQLGSLCGFGSYTTMGMGQYTLSFF